MFKHLLLNSKISSSPPRIPSCLKTTSSKNLSKTTVGLNPYNSEPSWVYESLLTTAPDIPDTDYDESDSKPIVIEPFYINAKKNNVWENAKRHSYNKEGNKKNATNTLKESLKYRPPVAEFVKEITKATEEDMKRKKKREKNRRYQEEVETEAQQIYREILEVVKENSPASLPVSRGSMVGFGGEENSKQGKLRSRSGQPQDKKDKRYK